MATIKPFKGFCPKSEYASEITSPPYDVLSSDEARSFINNNPKSFLRVIKPEVDYKKDKEPSNELLHKHAKNNLHSLIKKKLLIQDRKDCFYLYKIQMGSHFQIGLVCAVSITEYNKGIIKKHEFTRPDKENDRTEHIKIINANSGPVFLTFRNNVFFENNIKKFISKTPEIFFKAEDSTVHTLWKIDLVEDINLFINFFASIPSFYIADGHHRAASAARVQKIKQNQNIHHIGNEDYNYFLAVIFPDNQMQILDYNRVVKDLNNLSENKFISLVKSKFHIKKLLNRPDCISKKSIGMFLNNSWYCIQLKDSFISNNFIETIEASVLQNNLLLPILGIDNPRTNDRIDFVGGIRGLNELEKRCNDDSAIAFALPPVQIDELLMVADLGEVMPPKSTWFEPKLRSGMVVRLLD